MAKYLNAVGNYLVTSESSKNTIIATIPGASVVGTAANDTIRGFSGTYTYSGGTGDDIYILGSQKDIVVEKSGGGNDTVKSYYVHSLADNVENLSLAGQEAWFGSGNNLDNIVIGDQFSQQIDGKGGNDVLIGGAGSDTFIVRAGNGSDLVADFDSVSDFVRIYDYGITNFSQIKSALSQVGSDAVVKFGNGEKLVLSGVNVSDLKDTNFQFQKDTSQLKLTFSDEFDSLSLLSNGGTWRTEYGYGGPGTIASRTLNTENQIYMEAGFKGTGTKDLGVNPFAIDQGVLKITAAPTTADVLPYVEGHSYTSGLITSKFSFAQEYGYFEVRAKLPEGQGFWPAFWLLPTDNSWPPELDIFESLGKDPNTIYMTSHSKIGPNKNNGQSERLHIDTTEFHKYGAEWGPKNITFFVDGVEVGKMPTPADMNKEMFILANLAVGGPWAGRPDATTGVGVMEIDYIRAYATADTVSTTINKVHTIYNSQPGNDTSVVPITPATPVTPVVTPVVVQTTAPGYAQVKGTANADALTGTSVKQELWGFDGNDSLRGGSSETVMHGGNGNDIYQVTSASHIVQENAGEGIDSVSSTISYTLTANVENMSLVGTFNIDGTGNDLDNRIIGNAGNNFIMGLGGNDQLDGGTGGTDTLIGGMGNDLYIVNNAGVTLAEKAGEGTDSVLTTISFTISANVENMTLSGSASINGTGNELGNRIMGNSSANEINGMAGNDTLTGGVGNDTFAFSKGFGNDIVTDFSSTSDFLKFTGVDKSAMTLVQSGSSVVIGFGGVDTVTLLNTKLTDPSLTSHFQFF